MCREAEEAETRDLHAHPKRFPLPFERDPFNPFSISFSKRHSYLRKARVQKGRAPPTCKVRACKYLRGHVHTFQPFIDLLTRRHPSVLSLHPLSVPSLFSCSLFLSTILCRYQKSQSRFRIIDRGGLENPYWLHEFRNNMAQKRAANGRVLSSQSCRGTDLRHLLILNYY